MSKNQKKLCVIFIVCLFFCGSLLWAGLEEGDTGLDVSAIPNIFKMSPKKQGYYTLNSIFYNPNTDRYVFFYTHVTNKAIVYSRLYKSNGKTAGPRVKVVDFNSNDLGYLNFAYNPKDNVFFMVGTDRYFNVVNGLFIDGDGRLIGSLDDPVEIKPETKALSGFLPRAEWIQSTNQFAVYWTYVVPYKPENPKNGQYLSVINTDGSKAVNRRKVIKQTMNNNMHFSSVVPVEDKLLWGFTDDGPGIQTNPVVGFSKINGKFLKNIAGSTNGFIYPGGPGAYVRPVNAMYNPVEGICILYWNIEDNNSISKTTSASNFFRCVDKEGNLIGPKRWLPKKTAFQSQGIIKYNSVENRFFWIYGEYKVRYQHKPYKSWWGGKLYGVYVDNKGKIQDKKGRNRFKPIPLTDTFLNPDHSMYIAGAAYNASSNEYFIIIIIYDNHDYNTEFWGLIYK